MNGLIQLLGTTRDLLMVVVGFGLIVFIHELGHFIAARWAGIRVLAFAIGFGPSILSYRKGLGLRRGSSESEYLGLLHADAAATATGEGRRTTHHRVSPTEYRLNILPLGGYVKMLGQEDLNPEATSASPDSYQNCRPWKRMVVISAGVVMNMLTAAALFIVVFMVGLRLEPAKVGSVIPGSPAATTVALNADQHEVTAPGLQPGDVFLSIDGRAPNSFSDLVLATAMAEPNKAIEVEVFRPGVGEPLVFNIRPEPGQVSGLLEIGVEPSRSARIPPARDKADEALWIEQLSARGLHGVRPGMSLVRISSLTDVRDGNALFDAIRNSGGEPLEVEFADDAGRVVVSLVPRPQVQIDHLRMTGKVVLPVEHLLGLMPVMKIAPGAGAVLETAAKQDLRPGDVFARIGSVEYPSIAQGMAEIKSHKGQSLPMVVLRRNAEGIEEEVSLPQVRVSSKGRVGFSVSDTGADQALVALPDAALVHPGAAQRAADKGAKPGTQTAQGGAEALGDFRPAATEIIISPGTRLLTIAGQPVGTFAEVRAALRHATREAQGEGAQSTDVVLTVQRPLAGRLDASAPIERFVWSISREDAAALHRLGWESPVDPLPFEPEQVVRIAENPIEAVKMGLSETRRVMLTTYITFARLAQGTVKVEHLKGPVGIAHLGTLVAGRGFIWLLFFLALISVNLAVINFLPLPIVDGGQFLFLVFEQVRGKPVPVSVQNAATMVGLVLIGSMFLIVTYNDITNLLGL